MVRRRGYAATSVEEICQAAGATKGAFFHHFASKEALAVAAASAWTDRAAPLFDHPSITRHSDPLDRLLAHIDLRMAMIDGPLDGFTCFVGTMAQEVHETSPAIREACGQSIGAYCDRLAEDIAAAIATHGNPGGITPIGLATHVQAGLQGAFIIAKANGDPQPARETVLHLRRYIEMLFGRKDQQCPE